MSYPLLPQAAHQTSALKVMQYLLDGRTQCFLCLFAKQDSHLFFQIADMTIGSEQQDTVPQTVRQTKTHLLSQMTDMGTELSSKTHRAKEASVMLVLQ